MESVRMRKGLIEDKEDLFIEHQTPPHRDVDIFMIANPISGSREAVAYTDLSEKEYEFRYANLPGGEIETSATVRLKIINILQPDEAEQLKSDVQETLIRRLTNDPTDNNSVIILIWAGDGTFMNIAQDF
jgi:hypothetical protein